MPLEVVVTEEGYVMTTNVICFLLGTVFPLATVGWMIAQ
jgi:hypothetical protein